MSSSVGTAEKKRNVFSRIALFVRQVIGELKKVITPTRSELITYATVVLVFVLIMMAFVGVVDFGIEKLMMLLFA